MRRHRRVAGEAWRVRATSGVRASEPALPRSLRCDLGLCCCVISYSVLILSTTVAIPQRCRRSLHRHRHPRRTTAAAATAAAAAAAAAAVRRLSCCGCGWSLLRLFLKKLIKNWLFCCCGDDRGDQARPSCCAATHLAGPSPPPPPPPPQPLLRLRLRCCYCAAAAAVLLLCCCLSDGVVLGLPLSVSRGATTAPCLNSKFDVASPLPACDVEAVYSFSAIRSPQTQPKACPSESGLFLA